MHNDVFQLATKCWAHAAARRPSIGFLRERLEELQREADAEMPAARDIGMTCYRALEESKGRRQTQRGGSILVSSPIALPPASSLPEATPELEAE